MRLEEVHRMVTGLLENSKIKSDTNLLYSLLYLEQNTSSLFLFSHIQTHFIPKTVPFFGGNYSGSMSVSVFKIIKNLNYKIKLPQKLLFYVIML